MEDFYYCNREALEDFVTSIFSSNGFSEEHAKSIARALVLADMRGIGSHGVVRVELYLRQTAKGAIAPKAVPKIVKQTSISAVIDGCKAAGAPVSEFAGKLARELASESGAGFVAVRNSNHYGPSGNWAMQLAEGGMIGFSATNTPPLVAAPASKTAVIGNNPFSICVQASDNRNLCIDISNGVMAFGKIHEYKRSGKPFPENSWLDDKGNPTTDPFATDFLKYIALPFGLHKGFGLAVMVEAVTSMLSGGAVADEFAPPGADLDANNPTSHIFAAIRLDAFASEEEYIGRADRLIDYLHGVEARTDGDRVLYPGEPEDAAYRKSLKEGIKIPAPVKDYLLSEAQKAGIATEPSIFCG